MHEYSRFGASSSTNLTFDTLRSSASPHTPPSTSRTRKPSTTGLVLLPPATWTNEAGSDESSADLYVDEKGEFDGAKETGTKLQEPADLSRTPAGMCCLACLALVVLIGVPSGVAIWDIERDPERPDRRPPMTPPPPPLPPSPPSPPLPPPPAPPSPPSPPSRPPPSPPAPPLAPPSPLPPDVPLPSPPPSPPLNPGYIYAVTLEYTLMETHYGGATHSTPNQSGRRLSDATIVESILRNAMSELPLAGFYVHEVQLSPTTSRWVVTVTIPEHEKSRWEQLVNSPVFLPSVNSAWDGNSNSLFAMVPDSQVERGRHPTLAPPPPPEPPSPPPNPPVHPPSPRTPPSPLPPPPSPPPPSPSPPPLPKMPPLPPPPPSPPPPRPSPPPPPPPPPVPPPLEPSPQAPPPPPSPPMQPPPPPSPPPPSPSPPPPNAPGGILLTDATFQLNELYHSGSVYSATDAVEVAQLTEVVSNAVTAGGVDVYAMSLTALSIYSNVVEWQVAVTFPTAQIAALNTRHDSPSFGASIGTNAYALGGVHTHSLYETHGPVDASATPHIGTAPSPPPV